jgi:hypothetical protein
VYPGAPINFGDLTTYLTYGTWQLLKGILHLPGSKPMVVHLQKVLDPVPENIFSKLVRKNSLLA